MTTYVHAFIPGDWEARTPRTEAEQLMREGFIDVAQSVLAEGELYDKSPEAPHLAGIELELPLITPNWALAPQSVRDAVVAAMPGQASIELAAHQLEIVTDPVDLHRDLHSLERGLADNVARAMALLGGARVVRLGTYPLVELDEVMATTGYDKYIRSPRWHMDHQRSDASRTIATPRGDLDIRNAMVVGLMNSVQLTVDAVGFDDAVDKLNRAWMISPWATALGAHSSHLAFTDTGFADVRMHAWSVSHDCRSHADVLACRPTRVGLPRRYCTGLHDYFNRILSWPFVMDDPVSLAHPFEVGNGIYWRDARLKFFRDKKTIAVEFRPVPLQPSLLEDVAMMLFFIGRLAWSQMTQEPLLRMDWVIENKNSATLSGLSGDCYVVEGDSFVRNSMRRQIAIEIGRAREGLCLLGADSATIDHYFIPLEHRLETGTPADRFRSMVNSNRTGNGAFDIDRERDAIIRAIMDLDLVSRS